MALKSKAGVIGIILASLVVIASLIFLGCVLKYHNMGEGHGHDHTQGHGEMHGEMMQGEEHGAIHGSHGDDADAIGIVIENAYARANGASAKAGAAFMVIKNYSDADDRLISATTDIADKATLHSHTMDANSVMKMGPVTGGLAVPAHSEVLLKRGGTHVMMMGLKQSMNQGDVVSLVLTFEKAGEVIVEIPVDLKR